MCDGQADLIQQIARVRACLESLYLFLDKTVDTIVVINDCSDAFTTAYLRSLDFIVLKENTENLGFSGSANKGLLSSSADYVCLMNSDIVVTDPDWLNKMIVHDDPQGCETRIL